jgi:glycosyltransferase involved in cell wall biosynthesis
VRGTLALSINASWNVLNFRRGLVSALREAGWHVVALTPADSYADRLAEIDVEHVPVAIDSAGLSPLADLRLLARYRRLLKRISPAAYLGYTAKPNVYGSLAAQALGIPVINNISGLGTAFIDRGPASLVLPLLYRLALRRSATVFFQNPEDRGLFIARKLVPEARVRLLPGSGIDLARFAPTVAERAAAELFTFLLPGRLLWQKGVREYVEAARLVRREAPETRFQLLGFLDVANVSAVGRRDVDSWEDEGLVEYLGHTDDVRPYFAAADCIVLPSYREGLPRSLLEGAAMAKPLIATDVPGCRQAVEHEANGLLCAVRDPRALAEAMLAMIRTSSERRAQMGEAGRRRVERDYGEETVTEAYLQALDDALTHRPSR